jgi:hypothetical protein
VPKLPRQAMADPGCRASRIVFSVHGAGIGTFHRSRGRGLVAGFMNTCRPMLCRVCERCRVMASSAGVNSLIVRTPCEVFGALVRTDRADLDI